MKLQKALSNALKKVEPASGSACTIADGISRLHNLQSFLEWFGNPDPNGSVNQVADLLGMTPNDFKDQIAIEARRIMFVRSVK